MKKMILWLIVIFILAGCGSIGANNGKKNNNTPKINRGYYVDSSVIGADYICGNIKDKTNSKGEFKFYKGDSCKFLIDNVVLREVDASKLYNGVKVYETNLPVARVLQTLDKDGDPDKNDIEITSNSAKCLKQTFNSKHITSSVSDEDIDKLYNCLKEDSSYNGKAVTENEAKAHIKKVHSNKDTTPPVITLNGANSIELTKGTPYLELGATAIDNIDDNVTITITGRVDINRVGTYIITYTAKDSAGNESNTIRTVNVVLPPDRTPPTIYLKGDNPIVITKGTLYTEPGVIVLDGRDGVSSYTVIDDSEVDIKSNVDINRVGTYTIIYTVKDSAGNESNATRTVKVINTPDTKAPIITIKGANPLILEAGDTYKELGATALDDVDSNLTVTVSGSVDNKRVGIYIITYSVKDSSNNKASKTRTIQVVDTTPPIITLKGDKNITLHLNDNYIEQGVNTRDNAIGDINVTIRGSVDTSKIGEYTLTYTAKDNAGNIATVDRKIKVIDETAPSITLKGENPLTLEAGDTYTELGATAVDNADTNLTIKISGNVDNKTVGSYTIIYSTQDSSGNEANKTRTVLVTDTTPPTISLKGDENITLRLNDTYIEQGVNTSDNANGEVEITIDGSVDTSKDGEYILTYRATDKSGNSAAVTRNVKVTEELENLMHLTNDSNITKRVKILGIGSGGSHHLLFHHSDGKTVIENGDMGAMSISHDGGKTFKQIVSNVHAKDLGSGAEKYTLPRLFSIAEHPTHPDWLFGVASYGVLSFSTDRGKTWHSQHIGAGYLVTNKITIRQEGNKIIAYFAAGYKLETTSTPFNKLGVWVDITDIPHDIKTFKRGEEYNFILLDKKNPTGLSGKYFYGDIVNLQGKLFVVGKGGLFVCEGDPKNNDNWKNITDSIFEHKDGVYPLDYGAAIGDKLYILAYGDSDDTNNTAGVYVHTKGDINNGKYNFKRIYKGLNLARFHKGNSFTRASGTLLKHVDTSNGKTYLYLIMQDVVYRLNVTDNSDTFERVTEVANIDGKTYSKGFILGQRNTVHWSVPDNGSYTSFTDSYQVGKMSFATSYFPSFSGLNTAYSYGGKIYVANTIEIKVSSDNGKTFNSYTSKVSNSGSKYDGKIKWYYGDISIYEDGFHNNSHKINISPTDDSVSFWWSGIRNRGMDNMVSTDIAINPNNPKEMMQTYMDSAAFFSDDAGESWHYTAGLKGILGDVYWTQWIKGNFYAQDRSGIYKFNKDNLEFERLRDIKIYMYLEESIRVRKYYDKQSDTLVTAGYQSGGINVILVVKHFSDENLREVKKITDIRKPGNGIQFTNWPGISRSFKDVYCDGEYVYAINAELGIIKIPLNNLPDNYNDFTFGLDKDEHVFSGLFDKNGSAILSTAIIEKLNDDDSAKIERDYALKYSKLIYSTKPFELKKVDIVSETNTTIIPRGNGLNIDGKEGVVSGKSMLTLLGIDPKNSNRILASIATTSTVIESKDGGKTWSEFLPQISGNSHGNQSGNAVFAPSSSLYDIIILGNGSAYGVLK